MAKGLWSLIWSSFYRTQSILSGVIAIVVSIILWFFTPDRTISLSIFIPILIIFWIIVMTLVDTLFRISKLSKRILPRVLNTKMLFTSTEEQKVLCLLEPSEFFSHDILVSFYYVDDDNFERFIGVGKVLNIQEDGIIQVTIDYTSQGSDEIITKLAESNAGVLKKIRVKPTIPRTYFNLE